MKILHLNCFFYSSDIVFIQDDEDEESSSGIQYCPLKSGSGNEKAVLSKMTLLSSHLLSNGAVGDQEDVVEGIIYL